MKLQYLEMPVPGFLRGKGTMSPINLLSALTRPKINIRPWFLIQKEFPSGIPFHSQAHTTVSTLNSGKN